MKDDFQACEICGGQDWRLQYRGKVRDGAFGNLTPDECDVARCVKCGVERLNESACRDATLYETEAYRRLLQESDEPAGFMAQHDVTQLRNLTALWPESLRFKVIADIGCAAGSFADHVSGLAKEVICVEPCKVYHESLKERGYHVYHDTREALPDWGGKVGFVFCFSVIEHVQNPRVFLEEIGELLAPEGKLLLSTPNRRDILLNLKEDAYKPFFYRSVHRWYFDTESFAYCARAANLEVVESRCVQRFGLSNAMLWLRDGRPSGSALLPELNNPILDSCWKGHLESTGVGDYLYFKLVRA